MLRQIYEQAMCRVGSPDIILASIALGASLLLIIIGSVRASPISMLLALLIGIPGAIWILSKGKIPLGGSLPITDDVFFTVSGCYFFILAISIVSFILRDLPYSRPALFFLLVPLLVGLTAITALGANRRAHVMLCLIQVILIGLLLSSSQVLLFPDVIGMDPWYHKALVTEISNTQHLPPPGELLFNSYVHFPILHLTMAGMILMTGLPYHLSAIIAGTAPIIIVSCVSVYLLGALLFPQRPAVALLASLLLAINPSMISMTVSLIPNGFAVIFILSTSLIPLHDYNHSSSHLASFAYP